MMCRGGVFFVVSCGVFLLCCFAVAEGPRASLPLELCAPEVPTRILQNITENRRSSAKRREELNVRQFKNSEGSVILTNRPERYQNRKGFVEVNIHYSPITVQPQYRKLGSAAQYSSSNIKDLTKYYARLYSLDENLVYAVMQAESNFDPYAVSSAGARGLMQLMPATAEEMGVTDIFDPAQNIAGGTQYLAKMLALFGNNLQLALAGYNAGPNVVKQYNGIPPFPETQAYVRYVMKCYLAYKQNQLVPSYRVGGRKPRVDKLPEQEKKGSYMICFHSGYTQPADKIIDEDPYYYIQYGRHTTLVRKTRVKKILEPA